MTMLLCLNPFEIRVSFELKEAGIDADHDRSQSLRNQGFIRTYTAHGFTEDNMSQSLRNQGFIRTKSTS